MLAPIPANNANAFARKNTFPFRFNDERKHEPKIAAPKPADGFVPPRSPYPFPTLLWACGRLLLLVDSANPVSCFVRARFLVSRSQG